MSILKFELKKLWRQKKFLLLLLIVFLCTCAIFLQNLSQQSKMKERAQEQIEPFIGETDIIQKNLLSLQNENKLDEIQSKQLEYVKGMGLALFNWKSAIYNQKWNEIPLYEEDFLTNLQLFEKNGGRFSTLQGIEQEKAIMKNKWLRAHNLSYEDEAYPISPHLILKENTTAFLGGALGIFILLLLFGNVITVEKEHHTWLMLKTQPIRHWKLIIAKYVSTLIVILTFLLLVVGIGIIIPFIFGENRLNIQYPQIVGSEDTFTVISTIKYLIRGIVLFICASAFTFSLVILLSKWVKNSFLSLMLTCFVIIIGYFITDINGVLQSPLNPFQYYKIPQILAEVPRSTDLIYPLAAFLWSFFIIAIAAFLPDKEASQKHSTVIMKPFHNGKTRTYLPAFWKINIFEWRKIQRKGLLKHIYFLLLLLIAFGYFAISQQAQQKERDYIERLKNNAHTIENIIIPGSEKLVASLKEQKKNSEEISDELIVAWEKEVDLSHTKLTKNKDAIAAYEQEDWITLYEYQLFENKDANNEFENEVRLNSFSSVVGQFTLDVSIAEKKWLMEKKIQPIFSGEYVPTIYQYWGDLDTEKEKWEEDNTKIDNSGLFTLYFYLDNYFYFIPMILFLFLLGGGLAAERGKKNTLHFLKTQPLAVSQIFLGKVVHAAITVVLSSVGIYVFVILIGSLFNRFGDWQYPILHYDHNSFLSSSNYTGMKSSGGGFHFIPLGNYLVTSVVLFLFVILFLIILSIILSLFFKKQMSVLSTVVLILAAGYATSIQVFAEYAHLSPFTYFNIAKITNGELSIIMDNPNITVQTGALVLSISTLLLLVFGYLILNRNNRKKTHHSENFVKADTEA